MGGDLDKQQRKRRRGRPTRYGNDNNDNDDYDYNNNQQQNKRRLSMPSGRPTRNGNDNNDNDDYDYNNNKQQNKRRLSMPITNSIVPPTTSTLTRTTSTPTPKTVPIIPIPTIKTRTRTSSSKTTTTTTATTTTTIIGKSSSNDNGSLYYPTTIMKKHRTTKSSLLNNNIHTHTNNNNNNKKKKNKNKNTVSLLSSSIIYEQQPQKELPLILTSEKTHGIFECDYCSSDITRCPRIRCAICPDFDLCLECFVNKDHRTKNTNTNVHDNNNNNTTTSNNNFKKKSSQLLLQHEQQESNRSNGNHNKESLFGDSLFDTDDYSGDEGGALAAAVVGSNNGEYNNGIASLNNNNNNKNNNNGGLFDTNNNTFYNNNNNVVIKHESTHAYRVVDSTRFPMFPSLRGVTNKHPSSTTTTNTNINTNSNINVTNGKIVATTVNVNDNGNDDNDNDDLVSSSPNSNNNAKMVDTSSHKQNSNNSTKVSKKSKNVLHEQNIKKNNHVSTQDENLNVIALSRTNNGLLGTTTNNNNNDDDDDDDNDNQLLITNPKNNRISNNNNLSTATATATTTTTTTTTTTNNNEGRITNEEIDDIIRSREKKKKNNDITTDNVVVDAGDVAANNKKVRDDSNSEEDVLPIGNILHNNSINSNSNSNSSSIGITSYSIPKKSVKQIIKEVSTSKSRSKSTLVIKNNNKDDLIASILSTTATTTSSPKQKQQQQQRNDSMDDDDEKTKNAVSSKVEKDSNSVNNNNNVSKIEEGGLVVTATASASASTSSISTNISAIRGDLPPTSNDQQRCCTFQENTKSNNNAMITHDGDSNSNSNNDTIDKIEEEEEEEEEVKVKENKAVSSELLLVNSNNDVTTGTVHPKVNLNKEQSTLSSWLTISNKPHPQQQPQQQQESTKVVLLKMEKVISNTLTTCNTTTTLTTTIDAADAAVAATADITTTATTTITTTQNEKSKVPDNNVNRTPTSPTPTPTPTPNIVVHDSVHGTVDTIIKSDQKEQESAGCDITMSSSTINNDKVVVKKTVVYDDMEPKIKLKDNPKVKKTIRNDDDDDDDKVVMMNKLLLLEEKETKTKTNEQRMTNNKEALVGVVQNVAVAATATVVVSKKEQSEKDVDNDKDDDKDETIVENNKQSKDLKHKIGIENYFIKKKGMDDDDDVTHIIEHQNVQGGIKDVKSKNDTFDIDTTDNNNTTATTTTTPTQKKNVKVLETIEKIKMATDPKCLGADETPNVIIEDSKATQMNITSMNCSSEKKVNRNHKHKLHSSKASDINNDTLIDKVSKENKAVVVGNVKMLKQGRNNNVVAAKKFPYDEMIVTDDPKNAWTVEEDLRLISAISTLGLGNWADISEVVSGNGKSISPRRCMERYFDDFLGRYGYILPAYTLVADCSNNDTSKKDQQYNSYGHSDGHGGEEVTYRSSNNNNNSKSTGDNFIGLGRKRKRSERLSQVEGLPQGDLKKSTSYRVVPTSSLPEYEGIWPRPFVPSIPSIRIGDDVGRDHATRAELSFFKASAAAATKTEAYQLREEWAKNRLNKTGGPKVLPLRIEDIKSLPGAELAGFMPRRGDFDIEWDNEAEKILAEMEFFVTDSCEDKALKIKIIEIYNTKISDREKRKKFLVDRGLLDYRRNQEEDAKLPSDELDLVNRMRLFARFHSAQDHSNFVKDLLKAMRLRKEISKLQTYRRMGFTSLAEAELFELKKEKRKAHKSVVKQIEIKENINNGVEQENRSNLKTSSSLKRQSNSPRMIRKRISTENDRKLTPREEDKLDDNTIADSTEKYTSLCDKSDNEFNLKKYKDYHLLSSKEIDLCQRLQLRPEHYLEAKKELLKISIAQRIFCGNSNNSKPQSLFMIDIEKRGSVVEFFQKSGWT